MLCFIIPFSEQKPSYQLSGDGKSLSIIGPGEVTKEDVSLAGNKVEFVFVSVKEAESLSKSAFEGCTNLKTIQLNDSVLSKVL